ncbi:unnamed protein product [Amoebophrya sp. A25]|nr:unnamed protein product [Amoebophrya sp. A25]|eukprot:GSA25T00017959001.1
MRESAGSSVTIQKKIHIGISVSFLYLGKNPKKITKVRVLIFKHGAGVTSRSRWKRRRAWGCLGKVGIAVCEGLAQSETPLSSARVQGSQPPTELNKESLLAPSTSGKIQKKSCTCTAILYP